MKEMNFLLFVFFLTSTALPQNNIIQKAPLKSDLVIQNHSHIQVNTPGSSNLNANYVLVDYMQNAFSPAVSSLNPLAYDSYSDVVAIIHRGHTDYASGSGTLYYNISTDRGSSWNRISNAINNDFSQQLARYPSMAISNYQHNPNLNNALPAFTWPELLTGGSSFGSIGYAADQFIGAGNYTGDILTDDYYSSVPVWSGDNSAWVFWVGEQLSDAAVIFFRTQDFINIDQIVFPASVFQDLGVICLGGVSVNGVIYIGVLGTFVPPDPGNPIISGWYPGYIKSSDYGETWSDWQVVDFRQVPSISDYDRLYDFIKGDNYVSYCGDINVDQYGYVHFALALTDTTTDEDTGINSIVDLYETGDGWDAKIIYTGLIDGSFNNGPGLGQMGPSPYFAFNEDRDVMACQWVNGLSENLPWCDLFFSYRTLESNWASPINLTQSDSINNSQSHLAPTLAGTGPEYTAFSMYGYQDGISGPYTDTTATTNIYAAPITFNIESVPVELISFSAVSFRDVVILNWETASELNNHGFEIERILNSTDEWNVIGFVKGNGTSTGLHKYEFKDKGLIAGKYSYRLRQFDLDGNSKYSEVRAVEVEGPLSFELSQNFPNPFNPTTEINYQIAQTNLVMLKLYDVLGNEIQTIVNEVQKTGSYSVTINTHNLASGTYFYKLESGKFIKVRKMLLIK